MLHVDAPAVVSLALPLLYRPFLKGLPATLKTGKKEKTNPLLSENIPYEDGQKVLSKYSQMSSLGPSPPREQRAQGETA